MLSYLLERAASWLRYQELAASGLTLMLRYGDYQTATGHERFPHPTQRDDLLREAAHERLVRLYTRRLPLRLLGVELTPLTVAVPQAQLFGDSHDERQRRLAACKDAIRQRFGFTSLLSGSVLGLTKALPSDREHLRLRTPCLTR
jgi:DNA polymerase-4